MKDTKKQSQKLGRQKQAHYQNIGNVCKTVLLHVEPNVVNNFCNTPNSPSSLRAFSTVSFHSFDIMLSFLTYSISPEKIVTTGSICLFCVSNASNASKVKDEYSDI